MKGMQEAGEELKLGAGLAQEFGLDPRKNTFTNAHPNAYYLGIYLACTNRSLPQREAARQGGMVGSDHAYEVLKLGFADASGAMGRPVLTLVHNTPTPKRSPRVAAPAKAPKNPPSLPTFSFSGKPNLMLVFLVLVALAVLLTVLQNFSLTRRHTGGVPPPPGSEAPADSTAPSDDSI